MRTISAVLALALLSCMVTSASDMDISAAPPIAVLTDYDSTSVPTSLTDVCGAGKDCWLGWIIVSNPTASAITILAQDGQGTPFKLFPTVSVCANCMFYANFQTTGKRMVSGMKIQAGASGLHLSFHARASN